MFIIKLINFVINLISLIIIFDAILSFLSITKKNIIIININKIADYFLNPIRAKIKNIDIGFDISPIIAIVLLKIIEAVLIGFFKIFV